MPERIETRRPECKKPVFETRLASIRRWRSYSAGAALIWKWEGYLITVPQRLDAAGWRIRQGSSGHIRARTAQQCVPLPSQVSAAAGINAILRGLCRHDSWRFSWLRRNSGDYLWEPLATHFTRHDGKVRLGARATGLQLEGDRVKAGRVSEAGQPSVVLPEDHALAFMTQPTHRMREV